MYSYNRLGISENKFKLLGLTSKTEFLNYMMNYTLKNIKMNKYQENIFKFMFLIKDMDTYEGRAIVYKASDSIFGELINEIGDLSKCCLSDVINENIDIRAEVVLLFNYIICDGFSYSIFEKIDEHCADGEISSYCVKVRKLELIFAIEKVVSILKESRDCSGIADRYSDFIKAMNCIRIDRSGLECGVIGFGNTFYGLDKIKFSTEFEIGMSSKLIKEKFKNNLLLKEDVDLLFSDKLFLFRKCFQVSACHIDSEARKILIKYYKEFVAQYDFNKQEDLTMVYFFVNRYHMFDGMQDDDSYEIKKHIVKSIGNSRKSEMLELKNVLQYRFRSDIDLYEFLFRYYSSLA